MPPLSDGIAAIRQLFSDAHCKGAGLTLTVEQVENLAIASCWVERDLDVMRARLRALEIEVAALTAVGAELELPLDDTPAAKERAKEALLDAMADGKVVMIDAIRRRPAFCDGRFGCDGKYRFFGAGVAKCADEGGGGDESL